MVRRSDWYHQWWKVRRLLLVPAVDYRISVVLSLASVAVGLAALTFSQLSLVGWVLTAVGFVGAMAYIMDSVARKHVLRESPTLEKDIRPENFIYAPLAPTTEYRFVRPTDSTERQLYPYIDLCHYSPHIRAENHLTRAERIEIHGRWNEICPQGFLHLERRIHGEWRPIAISEIFPLTVEGYDSFTRPDQNLQLRGIDLDRGELRRTLDRRQRVLLLNIWVVDRAFKGVGHGKSEGLGGQANALVLRHIAEFWNSRNRFPTAIFIAETSNKHLVAALLHLAFRPVGLSKIGVQLYRLETSVLRAIFPESYAKIVSAVRTLELVPLHAGTAAVPRDWDLTFPRR